MTKKELVEIYGLQIKQLGVNINCITKKELDGIVKWRCKHNHTSFEHPACFRRDNTKYIEKIGALDIETSGLQANFGVMLCWYIKDIDAKKIEGDTMNLADLKAGRGDSRIVRNCVKAMRKYDRFVTHFGKYFDLPFIATRFLYWKRKLKWPEEYPVYGSAYHTDVWMIAKRKLRLHSNRQGAVSETILGKDIKTRIHPELWSKLLIGTEKEKIKAIDYIKDHCIKDIKQLEGNYLALRSLVREGRTSI